MNIRNIFLCLFMGLFLISYADDSARLQIESDLEKFRLESASKRLNKLNNEAYKAFYQTNILVYQYMATQSNEYLNQLDKKWKPTLNALNKLPNSDPMRDVMKAEIHCKHAVVDFFNEKYFSAVRQARSANNLVEAVHAKDPNKAETLKIQGLFNVAFHSVPRKYQWLTNLLGYTGDVEKGMAQLQKASEKSSLLRMEAVLVAYYIERNILVRPEMAVQRIYAEKIRSGNSLLLDFALASGYLSMKKNEKALKVLQKRDQYKTDEDLFFISYWDYMLGRAYYHKQEYTKAFAMLTQFLKDHKGTLYRKDAMFRQGMSCILGGNYEKGKRILQKMGQMKNSGFDADEYASYMSNQFVKEPPSNIVKELFRARNYYDGGYNEEAKVVLKRLAKQESLMSSGEKAEFYYRYGRLYHAEKKSQMALKYYQKATQQVHEGAYQWMQVYAYYYMGEIARSQKNPELAKQHYHKALDFDGYFYQAGLESRCKTALKAMK